MPARWRRCCWWLRSRSSSAPPDKTVALNSCKTAAEGCLVHVDSDATTFGVALATLGVVVAVIAILGVRFTSIGAGPWNLSFPFEQSRRGFEQTPDQKQDTRDDTKETKLTQGETVPSEISPTPSEGTPTPSADGGPLQILTKHVEYYPRPRGCRSARGPDEDG